MKKFTRSETAHSLMPVNMVPALKGLLYALIVLTTILFNACRKETFETANQALKNPAYSDTTWKSYPLDTMPAELYVENLQLKATSYPSTSYVSVPANNVYQSSPASSVIYSGVTYYGGPFQSCAYSIIGNTITFKMKRTDGYSFPVGSIIKIKLNNAGGTVKASVTLSTASSTCTLSISESNTWNLNGGGSGNPYNTRVYVATWYNPQSGYNFYTQPIKIVAVPTGWGAYLASFGVSVYSNGWGGFGGTDNLRDPTCNNSQMYQCVHFIQKYYLVVKNRNIGNANASAYWYYYLQHNLTQRINNGTGIPQQGDIICFQNSSGSNHVGIVAGVVVNGTVRVFQENVGQTLINGNYCSGYKDMAFTNNGNGYTISAATLGSSWSTLGWVR